MTAKKSIFAVPSRGVIKSPVIVGARRVAFAEPQPPTNLSPAQVRVISPILSTIALGYKNQEFVGETLFPRVPVPARGGQVLQFGLEDFKSYNTKRAPGGTTQRVTFGYEGVPYALVQDAIEIPVPMEYQQDAEAVPGIDLGTRAVRRAMNIILKSLEVDQAALATNASNYASANKVTLSGSSQWDNTGDASSDPVQQLLDYKETIRAQTGMYPNVIVFGPLPWIAFIRHPVVRDQFKFTTAASLTEEMIARLLQVEKVVVGKSLTSDDAGNLSDVWGDNVIMAYVPQQLTAMEEPSYGYTYTLGGTPFAKPPYYEERANSWIYGVNMDRVPVLSGISSGFLLINPSGASD